MLDEQLGLRPGDEDARPYGEGQGVEFRLAEEVLERDPLRPSAEQSTKRCALRLAQYALLLQVDVEAGDFQNVAEQKLCVESGVIHSRFLEKRRRRAEHIEKGPDLVLGARRGRLQARSSLSCSS